MAYNSNNSGASGSSSSLPASAHSSKGKGNNHYVSTDSHARLFGASNEGGMKAKPNFMKSDIFGTGLGSGAVQEKLMDAARAADEMTAAHAARTADKMGSPRSANQMAADGGGDALPYREYLQECGGHPAEGHLPAGSYIDYPMINARENGGNPVTGTGYEQERRPQRRRQFINNQAATSKFW